MPSTTQIMANGSRLLGTRDTLLAGQVGPLRAEIAASWQRSKAHGVLPDRFAVPHAADVVPCAEITVSADLLRLAAAPVADAVGADLAGTGVSLLVSDHEARILDRRAPDAGLRDRLDRLCLVPGYRYGEDTVGTTAISVALALRRPALVAAGEHYADTLTQLVCVAAPVIDRRTSRLLGTIGLACRAEAASPLMVALVKRAARDVELRLANGTRPWSEPAGDNARGKARSGWDSLTAAERAVAVIIAEGATNREAGAQLYLSRHTIDYHLRRIFRKLGVSSRVELTRLAITRAE